MRIAKRLGFVLLVVCAFSAMGVSSASAAPRFLAIPPGPLSAKALNTQVFTTAAGKVECTALKALNTAATAPEQTTQHATIDYEKCKAFGLAANVTPVLYLFHASGSVDLLNTVVITAIGCEVKVFPKNGLEKVLYRNLHGAISIIGEVTKILSEGKGAACSYKHEGNGVYVGVADVWLTGGGTLLWHAA